MRDGQGMRVIWHRNPPHR